MNGQTSPNAVVACNILDYLTKNRRPFSFDGLIDELIDNGIVDEEDRAAAREMLDGYYNDGTFVPMIMPRTTEIVLVVQFEPDEEVLHYLEENGGRENIGTIINKMYTERGLNSYEVKATILDLVTEDILGYDKVTKEVYIPTTT